MKAAVKKLSTAESYAVFIKYVAEPPYSNDYSRVMEVLRRGERGSGDRVRPNTATEIVALKVNGLISQTEGRRYLGLGRSRRAANAPSKRKEKS